MPHAFPMAQISDLSPLCVLLRLFFSLWRLSSFFFTLSLLFFSRSLTSRLLSLSSKSRHASKEGYMSNLVGLISTFSDGHNEGLPYWQTNEAKMLRLVSLLVPRRWSCSVAWRPFADNVKSNAFRDFGQHLLYKLFLTHRQLAYHRLLRIVWDIIVIFHDNDGLESGLSRTVFPLPWVLPCRIILDLLGSLPAKNW